MWRRTFFDASNVPLRGTISGLPKEASATPANVPTEESAGCDECHALIPPPVTERPATETSTESQPLGVDNTAESQCSA